MRRLTEAAQRDRDAFDRYLRDNGGCGCHSHPPCSYCTHPGNPMNQDENETAWEDVYDKDEALWYACCQMRRAARMLDLERTQHRDRDYLVDIYGNGLDLCADECEKAIDPTELTRMKRETHPDFCPTCGRSGAAREDNDTGGIDVCYDTWHEPTEVSNG